ncbi:UNKNOWN [Stylonychia lemnae]|uniref:Uncharacterized protein n=1 Tax=Stylonychia lemnae TaxID=5949 RepID=A0A078BB18_STYLE|nr:UNKNOWN [Stylonychia lemnae]|eukprot:CDW91594.1 UNKNOWN [Stylonychia lemnae]
MFFKNRSLDNRAIKKDLKELNGFNYSFRQPSESTESQKSVSLSTSSGQLSITKLNSSSKDQLRLLFENNSSEKQAYEHYDQKLIPLESMRISLIIDIDRTLVDIVDKKRYEEIIKKCFFSKDMRIKQVDASVLKSSRYVLQTKSQLQNFVIIDRKEITWINEDKNVLFLLKTFAPLSETISEEQHLNDIPIFVRSKRYQYLQNYHLMTLEECQQETTLNVLGNCLIQAFEKSKQVNSTIKNSYNLLGGNAYSGQFVNINYLKGSYKDYKLQNNEMSIEFLVEVICRLRAILENENLDYYQKQQEVCTDKEIQRIPRSNADTEIEEK